LVDPDAVGLNGGQGGEVVSVEGSGSPGNETNEYVGVGIDVGVLGTEVDEALGNRN